MGELPLPAIIGWLVHERFGGYDAETKIFGHMQHIPPDRLEDATAYRAHLRRLPDEQLRAAFRERLDELLPAAREAVEDSESSLFFNRLNAFANFEYWGRCPFWSVQEAVALTLGREPGIVNWAAFEREAATATPFAEIYRRLGDLIYRYVQAGKLDQPIEPALYLDWCRKVKLVAPPGLTVAVELHHGKAFDFRTGFFRISDMYQQSQQDLQAWADAYDGEVADHAATGEQLAAVDAFAARTLEQLDSERAEHTAEIAALKAEHAAECATLQDDRAKGMGKELKPRERESLLRLLIAAVIDGYGYNPSAAKSPFLHNWCRRRSGSAFP